MRTRIYAAAAIVLVCTPLMANAGFDIAPALAKSLAPTPAEPAGPTATTVAALEPKADPIAKIAELSAAATDPVGQAATGASAPATRPATSAIKSLAAVTVGGPIAAAPLPIREWQILPRDLTIYAALRRWAKEANWQVSWEVPMDYSATITGTFKGSFEDATEQVLTAYKNSEYPLQGCFYQDNQVLRVTRYVANSRDCL